MKFSKTPIEGLLIIEPEINEDKRGTFWRSFDHKEFAHESIAFAIVQTNSTLTLRKGSVRGMHFQKEPKAEDKIVQCLRGTIYDVVVDLRDSSLTYGRWFGLELSDKNRKIFLIPKGFAHGFQALTDNCLVHYYMSETYSPEHATGVRWNDPKLGIEWPLPAKDMSEKDLQWPMMSGGL